MLNCTSLNSAIFGNCNEYAPQDRAELGKKLTYDVNSFQI